MSIPIALYFKVAPNGWSDAALFVTLPFMDQMMWTAIISIIIILVVSYFENKGETDPKGIIISKNLFSTPWAFNIAATVVLVVCVVLYAVFW